MASNLESVPAIDPGSLPACAKISCGERHVDYLAREYVEHYHTERSHQGLGNVPATAPMRSTSGLGEAQTVCRTRLGGLLKHYRRAA